MRRLLVAVVAMTFVVGACGNDDDPAVTTGQADDTSVADHNSADVTFAQGMIPHHAQAIEMSELAAGQAESSEVRELASRIKEAQGPEIEQMRGWLRDWGEPEESAGGEHGGGHAGGGGMMSEEEMQRLESSRGAAFDRLFLEGMIRHHQGAVTMAEEEVRDGGFAPAKELARRIIDSQNAEIEEMRRLLAG